jgi:hypothetical protein
MKTFAVLALMVAAQSDAGPSTPPNDGGGPQSAGAVSDADNTVNLLHSALGSQPALAAPPMATEPDSANGQPPQAVPGGAAEPSANAADSAAVFQLPDLRNIGGAPRLPFQTMPVYSVNGSKVPEFRPRDIFTKEGMEAISFRKHPGLLVGNQFNLNADVAYSTFLEDDWRETKGDYRNMAQAMALGGDRQEATMIIRDVDAADVRVRSDAEEEADEPTLGQFKLSPLGGDSHLLEIQSIPFDLTVVKVKW